MTKSNSSEHFLEVSDLHAYYGESYIVQGVSFALKEGEILALLGRNGAGKTSTLRAIARVDTPELRTGSVHMNGQDLSDSAAWQASQAGINLVPEDRCIISGLTVEENLELAQIAPPIGWPLEKIYEHFMLAVARALARDIKLLLLDEPYEGLAPVIVQEIAKIVTDIKALGITTIIVEQNAVAALKLADRAVILDMGQVVFDGSADEVLNNEELRNEYLAI